MMTAPWWQNGWCICVRAQFVIVVQMSEWIKLICNYIRRFGKVWQNDLVVWFYSCNFSYTVTGMSTDAGIIPWSITLYDITIGFLEGNWNIMASSYVTLCPWVHWCGTYVILTNLRAITGKWSRLVAIWYMVSMEKWQYVICEGNYEQEKKGSFKKTV